MYRVTVIHIFLPTTTLFLYYLSRSIQYDIKLADVSPDVIRVPHIDLVFFIVNLFTSFS